MSKTDVSLKYLQCPPKNRLRSRPTAPPPWRTTRAKVMRAKGGKCFRIYFFAESVFYALQDLQNSPRSFVSFDTSPFLFRPPKNKQANKISSSSISRVPSNLPVCFLIRPKLKSEQTFFIYPYNYSTTRSSFSDRPSSFNFIYCASLSPCNTLHHNCWRRFFNNVLQDCLIYFQKKMKTLYLRYITTTIHFHHSHFLYPAFVLTFQFIYFFFFLHIVRFRFTRSYI